jgi:hypothetical protein
MAMTPFLILRRDSGLDLPAPVFPDDNPSGPDVKSSGSAAIPVFVLTPARRAGEISCRMPSPGMTSNTSDLAGSFLAGSKNRLRFPDLDSMAFPRLPVFLPRLSRYRDPVAWPCCGAGGP